MSFSIEYKRFEVLPVRIPVSAQMSPIIYIVYQIVKTMVTSYRNPKVRLGESNIHGKGLFAVAPIKKGEVVAVKGGHILDRERLKGVVDDIEKSFTQIEHDLWIGPLERSEVSLNKLYINHSCDPNAGIMGQVSFVAMRNIEEGEEVTYDLAMESDEGAVYWEVSCQCGKDNCRKRITGEDWKRKELQEKYGNYFSSYILEKIRKTA